MIYDFLMNQQSKQSKNRGSSVRFELTLDFAERGNSFRRSVLDTGAAIDREYKSCTQPSSRWEINSYIRGILFNYRRCIIHLKYISKFHKPISTLL